MTQSSGDLQSRSAILEVLMNFSESASILDDKLDRLSDSDSVAEIGEITGETYADIHRKSDLDDSLNVKPLDEPVIKAYLEKSHVKCEFKNCGYKKEQTDQNAIDGIESDFSVMTNSNTSTSSLIQSPLKNRRNSIASAGSMGRMETIFEEPLEPKVSVKEILARFETLRETAEVNLTRQSSQLTHNFISNCTEP